MPILDRITDGEFPFSRPPTIRTTGIAVSRVLTLIASGKSISEIVAIHPSLEPDDLQAAKEFFRLSLPKVPATGAARALGIQRRDLIALLNTVRIPRPIRRWPGTSDETG